MPLPRLFLCLPPWRLAVACAVLWPASLPAAPCPKVADPWLTLAVAVREGREAQLDCLLPGLAVNGHDPADLWENTPLHLAARHEQPGLVLRLLKAGADPDQPNAAGRSPLRLAIEHDASDSAAALILSGARIDEVDEQGRSLLFWAVAKNNVAIANLLLQRGADPQQRVTGVDGGQGFTVGEYARRQGQPAMLRLFETPREP
ncbi:ankyrin repeat domain-containing protein [Chitiniphilus purpureus]|uniref:Ankyrin repeat domain-containing protein n=1 Tax=Chitiniphilus purpureus TaxID=2981137 RepID=A0ABY6DN35_9NEIS|nr:ankyrin repeat domain-containing protein [Chitiniphilus sp. CD1]UXY15068.1 ankyrin repeat domain-containing protein [Chitiniphilus sp. CD1]